MENKNYHQQISDIYKKRNEAHDKLLECDKEIDILLKKFVDELEEIPTEKKCPYKDCPKVHYKECPIHGIPPQ